MYVLGIEVEIGGRRFERVHSVEITESIKTLGKRAVLKLPTTARLERQGDFVSETETAKEFKTGDAVVISFGYDGNHPEEFRGFVRKISPGTPLEVECEDLSYTLRRKNVQKAFRNATLEDLLNFILEGTGVELANEVPVINFRTFSFRTVNAAQALEKLRKDYGLTIYFRAYDQLVVGLASETDGVVVKYVTGCNVIKHSLKWEDEEDVKLKVKAVSVSKDNVFTDVTVGDPDGAQRTIYFYDLAAGEDLGERAQQEIVKYKYSGYRGTLTGFLLPVCRIGNTVRFADANFDNREGDYLAEEVKTTFGTSGGRRVVKLGLKLD
jgi:hypothetical protein